MFQKMLIAYDGSAGADRALQTNLQVLTVAGHVPQFAGMIDEIEEESAFSHHAAQEHLARALSLTEEAGVPLSGKFGLDIPSELFLTTRARACLISSLWDRAGSRECRRPSWARLPSG